METCRCCVERKIKLHMNCHPQQTPNKLALKTNLGKGRIRTCLRRSIDFLDGFAPPHSAWVIPTTSSVEMLRRVLLSSRPALRPHWTRPIVRMNSSSPSSSGKSGDGPMLHHLVMSGQGGLAHMMLASENLITKEMLEEKDEHGNTPMCIAAVCLRIPSTSSLPSIHCDHFPQLTYFLSSSLSQLALNNDMVRLLAGRGADVNGKGGRDNTPLHFAIGAVAAATYPEKIPEDKDNTDNKEKSSSPPPPPPSLPPADPALVARQLETIRSPPPHSFSTPLGLRL